MLLSLDYRLEQITNLGMDSFASKMMLHCKVCASDYWMSMYTIDCTIDGFDL